MINYTTDLTQLLPVIACSHFFSMYVYIYFYKFIACINLYYHNYNQDTEWFHYQKRAPWGHTFKLPTLCSAHRYGSPSARQTGKICFSHPVLSSEGELGPRCPGADLLVLAAAPTYRPSVKRLILQLSYRKIHWNCRHGSPKVRLGPAPWDSAPRTDTDTWMAKGFIKTRERIGSPLNLKMNQPWVGTDSFPSRSQSREVRRHFRSTDSACLTPLGYSKLILSLFCSEDLSLTFLPC